MTILPVANPAFSAYGRVITGYDTRALMDAMGKLPAPEDAVTYVPSEKSLEALPIFRQFQDELFGGMPMQLGYCNGSNHKLNAVEYHRDSEFNFAATDLIMLYGRQQDINYRDLSYNTALIDAFLAPAGTLFECYATTLHYAPCSSGNAVFRCMVALARGTNERLPRRRGASGEDSLLTHVNKWLIGHPDSGIQEARLGLSGANIEV